MRRGSRWVVVSPFGVFGGRRRGRGYNPGYDPRYGPGPGYGYGPGYGPGYGYGRRNSGGCLRDILLLEGGCCLAEALGGGCLLHSGWLLPALLQSLTVPGSGHGNRSQRALLATIASYQRNVSAHRERPVCRYTPSCSGYAAEAITRYGTVRGIRRAAGRLLRCRPGAAGGFDPLEPADLVTSG
jgi:putative membrane protein insertion efficiency factor